MHEDITPMQMINTILLNAGQPNDLVLQKKISNCCPQLKITSLIYSPTSYNKIIESGIPQLVFLELGDQYSIYSELFQSLENYNFETILIAPNRDYIFESFKYKISGYLLKPLNRDSLISTVNIALSRISNKANLSPGKSNAESLDSMIGIPTMEGYEFFPIREIIRCESYLKCTRVITKGRSDIISSYNIGEFTKTLQNHGFYAPHQSHLINLCKIRKYLKEGSIIMEDNTRIPVSRRRRSDFLCQILHV